VVAWNINPSGQVWSGNDTSSRNLARVLPSPLSADAEIRCDLITRTTTGRLGCFARATDTLNYLKLEYIRATPRVLRMQSIVNGNIAKQIEYPYTTLVGETIRLDWTIRAARAQVRLNGTLVMDAQMPGNRKPGSWGLYSRVNGNGTNSQVHATRFTGCAIRG